MKDDTLIEVPAGLAAAVPANDTALETPAVRDRYYDGINALYREAQQRDEIEPLVDELTRALAWVVFAYDSHAVTADLLRRLGGHLDAFEQRRLAERELAQRQEEGAPLH